MLLHICCAYGCSHTSQHHAVDVTLVPYQAMPDITPMSLPDHHAVESTYQPVSSAASSQSADVSLLSLPATTTSLHDQHVAPGDATSVTYEVCCLHHIAYYYMA